MSEDSGSAFQDGTPPGDPQTAPGAGANAAVAILFADIAGSTAIYERLGNVAAHDLIRGCLVLLREEVEAHRGRVVKTIGDELMCTFPDLLSAMAAATAMQQQAGSMAAPGGGTMALRIGIHHGPVLERDGDVFGDAVNVAARVTGLARGGQVLMTKDADKPVPPPAAGRVREIDRVAVKGRADEIVIVELLWDRSSVNTTLHPVVQRHDEPAHELILVYRDVEVVVNARSGAFVLGRDPRCRIVVDGSKVSRQHATIEWRRGKCVLVDKSTNGTHVAPEQGACVLVRREEFLMQGRGMLGLGTAPRPEDPATLVYRLR